MIKDKLSSNFLMKLSLVYRTQHIYRSSNGNKS